MINMKFKLDSYISLPVPVGTKSGAPVRVGELNGVATVDEGTGGNRGGWTSVALVGGAEFKVTGAGAAGVKIGDPIYITPAGALTLTAASNFKFGKITHKNPFKTDVDNVIVLIVQ